MKRILFCVMGICVAAVSQAQQRAHYTQYVINPFIINPALTGDRELYGCENCIARPVGWFEWSAKNDVSHGAWTDRQE